MGCEKNTVNVESLDVEDRCALLGEAIGFHEELSLEVKELAWNISLKCEGLSFVIVRIVTSMKGKKQVKEWSYMLECLENFSNGRYEMDKWVLSSFEIQL
ncbi:hypothetical protein K1719_039892 [Acacia pycnantha]|nr:hypothetical protein K1719_039892 [Acacia pycnantha]